MPEKRVVIVYTVTCKTLLGDVAYHFPGYAQLGVFIGRHADDVIFGDEDVKANEVNFNVSISAMSVDDYVALLKQQEGGGE